MKKAHKDKPLFHVGFQAGRAELGKFEKLETLYHQREALFEEGKKRYDALMEIAKAKKKLQKAKEKEKKAADKASQNGAGKTTGQAASGSEIRESTSIVTTNQSPASAPILPHASVTPPILPPPSTDLTSRSPTNIIRTQKRRRTPVARNRCTLCGKDVALTNSGQPYKHKNKAGENCL